MMKIESFKAKYHNWKNTKIPYLLKNTTNTWISKVAKPFSWITITISLILYLAPNQTVSKLPSFTYADKLVHFFNFFFLFLVFKIGYFELSHNKITLRLIYFSLLLEILQGWFPIGRSFDWLDFTSDVLGMLLAIATFPLLHKAFLKHLINVQRT